MMYDDNHRPDDDSAAPLPNRFTGGTLMGCLGILCVMTLPALLFIPIESLDVPGWVARLIPLVGVAMVVVGAWLLSRVPSRADAPAGDPAHPLTHAGRPPILERPASAANRVALLAALALCACCVAGYILVSMTAETSVVLVGTLLTYLAGLLLFGASLLEMWLRLRAPAWRWERVTVQRNLAPQAIPFACVGIVAVVWALFVAYGQGYVWARIGIGALILAGALTGPVLQRLPQRGIHEGTVPPSEGNHTRGRAHDDAR